MSEYILCEALCYGGLMGSHNRHLVKATIRPDQKETLEKGRDDRVWREGRGPYIIKGKRYEIHQKLLEQQKKMLARKADKLEPNYEPLWKEINGKVSLNKTDKNK